MKTSKLSACDRETRREEILFKRQMTRGEHRRAGRTYIKYACTAFPGRRDLKQNARYAGRPDGDMHKLPVGHFVRSNAFKRAAEALKALITDDTVQIKPKRVRAKKAAE
jgi:hypothetical protein